MYDGSACRFISLCPNTGNDLRKPPPGSLLPESLGRLRERSSAEINTDSITREAFTRLSATVCGDLSAPGGPVSAGLLERASASSLGPYDHRFSEWAFKLDHPRHLYT